MNSLSEETKIIVKKLTGKGYEFNLEEDEEDFDEVTLEKEGEEYTIEYFRRGPFLNMELDSHLEVIGLSTWNLLLAFSESYAKDLNKVLCFKPKNIKNQAGKKVELNVENLLLDKTYVPIKEILPKDKITYFLQSEELVIKKENKEVVLKDINFYQAFLEKMKKENEELPAFEIEKGFLKDYYTNASIVSIYYSGFDGYIDIEKINEEFFISIYKTIDKKKRTKVSSFEKVNEIIDDVFKKVKTSQKIKSVFHPPQHFYERFMDGDISVDRWNGIYDVVYDALRKFYSPLEIEEIASEYYKKETRGKIWITKNSYAFHFKDYLLYVDEDEHIVRVLSSSDDGIKKIIALMTENIETKLKSAISEKTIDKKEAKSS